MASFIAASGGAGSFGAASLVVGGAHNHALVAFAELAVDSDHTSRVANAFDELMIAV